MTTGMNIVDATTLARDAAASKMPRLPLTRGTLQVADREISPVTKVTYTVEIIDRRRRLPVAIDIEVADGRTSEPVQSIVNRLVSGLRTAIGLDERH